MRFDFVCRRATFLARPNRYLVHVQLDDGAVVHAHCADPGRLRELLLPGVTVYVSPAPPRPDRAPKGAAPKGPARKTAWDLRFVEHPEHGQLISLDTRVPNRIFAEGLQTGFFPAFTSLREVRREVPLPLLDTLPPAGPHSRIDFRLTDAAGCVTWVEVKSASLVVGRTARFPDAVTARGRRHLLELAAFARRGARAAVVFIVQRPDADAVEAHRATDPGFADALAEARAAGVLLLAATCRLSTTEIHLDRLIPVCTGALGAPGAAGA